jgi:hypothetical protein
MTVNLARSKGTAASIRESRLQALSLAPVCTIETQD